LLPDYSNLTFFNSLVLLRIGSKLNVILLLLASRLSGALTIWLYDTIRLHFPLSRVTSTAALMSRTDNIKEDLTMFGCLPLFLLPLTLQLITLVSNLLASILLTCPNHLNLPLWILSHCCCLLELTSNIFILCSLETPNDFINDDISKASIFLMSAFLNVKHSEPHKNTGITNNSYTIRKCIVTSQHYDGLFSSLFTIDLLLRLSLPVREF